MTWSVVELRFPQDEIVGTLDWIGTHDSEWPILARGVVDVPDGTAVELDVMNIVSVEPSACGGIPLRPAGVSPRRGPTHHLQR